MDAAGGCDDESYAQRLASPAHTNPVNNTPNSHMDPATPLRSAQDDGSESNKSIMSDIQH